MNVFQAINERMNYSSLALRLASENMANLHTPHYKARVPVPLRFSECIQKYMHLRRTNDRHLKGGVESSTFQARETTDGQETFAGNTVSYPKELERANEANLKQKQMATLFGSYIQMLQMVLKR
jgi:flagellar basal body rod protein FlgB